MFLIERAAKTLQNLIKIPKPHFKKHILSFAPIGVCAAIALSTGYIRTAEGLSHSVVFANDYNGEAGSKETDDFNDRLIISSFNKTVSCLSVEVSAIIKEEKSETAKKIMDQSADALASSLKSLDALDKMIDDLRNKTEIDDEVLEEAREKISETMNRINATPDTWPLYGEISSGFGYRSDPFTGRPSFHTGIDIRAKVGTPVAATASGTVVFSQCHRTYGNYIKIDHGYGIVTGYAHNSENLVNVGDYVEKGQIIAYSGRTGRVTGSHLHYEVILNGEFTSPMGYLK